MEKNIKKNTILNIIKTCCAIIFPVITFPYISRVLLPDNVGKVNFAQSFVSYFILIAGLGLSTYAIRECSSTRKDKEKLSKISSQLYSINVITTIVSYAFLFIILLFINKIDYKNLILIESTTIIFTTLGADWLNSAMEDFKYITIRSVTFQIIALILMLIFVRKPEDYYVYAFISAFATIGPNICNIWYRRKYCKVKFTWKIEWKKHIAPIMSLFAMMLSQTIFNNVDITMLGYLKDDYQVGIYSVAYKVVRIISQVVQSLSYVVIPRLSFYFANEDYENANKLLRKILSFNIVLGLPIVVGVIMLAKDIVLIVGGNSFVEAASIVRILIIMFMFSLVGGSFLGSAIMIPNKKEKQYMIICIITAVLNIILNAILIPKFASNGAAIASAINGLLIFILLLFVKIDKRIQINKILPIFVAPIIGCILICIICYICSFITNIWMRVICSVGISSTIYLLVLLMFKYEIVYEFFKNNKIIGRLL